LQKKSPRSRGVQLLAVFGGWMALAAAGGALAGSLYDLVLMDVQMPKMDGLEAARHIRAAETESGAGRTRMIALTADAQEEDRDAVLAAGLDGLLVKPLDRGRLCEALDATLVQQL
jgi:CheY-like chemotaxis protein